MRSLTLKNIPDDIYEQLKITASAHHRSLNSEILHCLEQSLCSHKLDAEARLNRARTIREDAAEYRVTDAEINKAKNEGRP